MERPSLARRDPDLAGLRVLVVGLGSSGRAAARLALDRGAQVTIAELRDATTVGSATAEMQALGAVVHTGGNPPELANGADLVVVSPGVPREIPLLRRADELGLPVWGEIELAARFCHSRVVGVTGSNGKSTVTTMIGAILERAGIARAVGGNLETPFADLLRADDDPVVYVLELSSFQLETVSALEPDVAIVLNLSPDHLDRYPSYEAYAEAKARLLELQAPDAHAILNADDDESRRFERAIRARGYRFSTRGPVDRGAFLVDGRLVLRTDAGEETVMPRDALQLVGDHNVANALAAALAARLLGSEPEAIADGLRSYRALPHRLEHVRTVGGVEYYNDSKATNPASAGRALAAFDAGRVHLILGGHDKGGDWESLAPFVRRHARQVLLVGRAAEDLVRRLGDAKPCVDCGTIPRAVALAAEAAEAGDVVLLSPGCASFDQYRNFEERGESFRDAVAAVDSDA